MNILRLELKNGLKSFMFWIIGLFFLVFASIVKFTGIAGDAGGATKEIFDKFPKVILAIFGMVNVDITTISGYYSMIAFYALICSVLYAISLGINVINREISDKTFEFIFTKPRKRSYIINMKFLSSTMFLILFNILNYIISVSAVSTLKLGQNINKEIFLFSLSTFIISMLFCTLSVFIATVSKNHEKSSLYGNLVFMITFILGIIYDMLDDGGLLRILTPFKYIEGLKIIQGDFDYKYLIFSIVLSSVLYIISINIFEKKELK